MKKFLSLVLAMIMTMSLVTISAGATEYKDLTDKDEIKYEEAVAVLNRIGVITGYPDGSFQPETELTRGAAAKIIVSLMIGPDAAAALPNTSSPYPDVPAGHTFAGVISYCKTKGYISGYGDGNFKPTGTLTGYAFAKMLLGALGYSSDIERFTGSGWTMNVANIANVAGLLDRISFDGAAAVTRDEACQLALNTLKATTVTYGGTSVVNGSTGSYTIQGTTATLRTSNNRDINANIGRKDWYGGNNQGSDYLTLEFGEEHFKDLRLEHDRYDPAHDEFGRPSNEWSYKKVTIGTFPLEADYTFTTQVAHVEDTDGTKEKALGLRNFDLVSDGGYSTWNGWGNDGRGYSTYGGTTTLWLNGKEDDTTFAAKTSKVADIADYTDNGTLVEVYVSYVDADWITDVVVIQTQLMEVKKIASDYVTLDQKEPDVAVSGTPNGDANVGFNFAPIDVKIEQVKDSNEDCYNVLKDLKAGDYVAIVPVTTDDGKTYEAAEVYVPETVSGTLTRVDTYGIGGGDKERGAIEITVGGTSYKIADWNDEMWALTDKEIKATRKDVTLHMDKYGNALLAEDVGSTNDFMVIGNFYQALSGNKVCTFVHGWDIGGNELDLNLGSSVKVNNHNGTQAVYGHVIGELVKYTSDGATGDADYRLVHNDVYDVYTNLKNTNAEQKKVADSEANFEIKASNLLVPLADKDTTGATIDGTYRTAVTTYKNVDYHNYYFDKSVKFIYVTLSDDGDEIDSIEFKNGAQNVTQKELTAAIMGWAAQGCVKKDQVKAVVIKRESNDASLNNMLYVTNYFGMKEYDKETGEKGFEIEALMYMDGKWVEDQRIIVDKDLKIGAFATYTARESAKYAENYYHVKNFTRHNANPAALFTYDAATVDVTAQLSGGGRTSEALLRMNNAYAIDVAGDPYSYNLTKITAAQVGNSHVAKDTESYVLGDYRGVSTTIDSAITNPDGIIVTKNAKFLNMVPSNRTYVENGVTRYWKDVDIDETKDLIDKVYNKTTGKVALTVLLNEKPDSDGFRTAYLVIVSDIGGGAGAVTPDATTYELALPEGVLGSVNGGAYQEGPLSIPAKTTNVTVSLKGDKGTLLTAASAYGVAFTASNGVLTGVLNNVTANGSVTGVAGYQVTSAKVVGTYIQFAMKNMSNGQMLEDSDLTGLITTPFADKQAMNQLVADKLMATGNVERATTNSVGDITVSTRTSGGSYADKTIVVSNIVIKLAANSASDAYVEAAPATTSDNGKKATVVAAGKDVLDIGPDPSVVSSSVFPNTPGTYFAPDVKSTIVALDFKAAVAAAIADQKAALTDAQADLSDATTAETSANTALTIPVSNFGSGIGLLTGDDNLAAVMAWNAWKIAQTAVSSNLNDATFANLKAATNNVETACSGITTLSTYYTLFIDAARDWEDALADKLAATKAVADAQDLPVNKNNVNSASTATTTFIFSDGLKCYPNDGQIANVGGNGNSWRKTGYVNRTPDALSTGLAIQVLEGQANPVIEVYLASDVAGTDKTATIASGATPIVTVTVDISGIEYAD